MVQPGIGGLDTPRTNVGDATYLSRQPEFDISQEASFVSPTKDRDLLHQLRNGGRPNFRTPRGTSRPPFGDRRNLPAGIGGAEFTPLLKSATRNTARRNGKENGAQTPAFLGKIDEDMTPIPSGETSIYGPSRNASSILEATPLPEVDSSSTASTPLVMRKGGRGPLQDGKQLSLREQENVIDKIEKENFGLKLKIHFLEEALRKAGPGFSEAALKENTELKVDKVTMQRELQKYKKQLTSAERDLETYRQQMLNLQEKAKRKHADESQRAEMERLQRVLEDREADIEDLQRQLEEDQKEQDKLEKLHDEIGDLEADVREKDRAISEREDELDDLRAQLRDATSKMKEAQKAMIELEEKAKSSDHLEEAKETIEDLEAKVRRLEQQMDDMKDRLQDAVTEKDRAETDLEELQEEMADKSMVTKGLSRQIEEKLTRLQEELDQTQHDYATLERQHDDSQRESDTLKAQLKKVRQERDDSENERQSLARALEEARAQLVGSRDASESERQSLARALEEARAQLNLRDDEKAVLQTRHEALTSESKSLQRDVARLQRTVEELEDNLERERQHALGIERDVRGQSREDVERLKEEISDLQAEVREKEILYDNDSEKWETERHTLESERERAEQRAAGLQRTIEKLREAEGTLSDKEMKLQEAIQSETDRRKSEEAVLSRQIEDLQQDLQSRQTLLEDLRREVSAVRDELRQSQLEGQAQAAKVEGLEDEVEVLQNALDEDNENAQRSIEHARQECEDLKRELESLREIANATRPSSASPNAARRSRETVERLQKQLSETTTSLTKTIKEKQTLQDQLANINIQLHTLKSSLAQVTAEREEMEDELRRAQVTGEDTYRVDQERLDLRTAKMKLDSEVRRLKEENKALAEQRDSVEKTLEDEIEKAAVEEERLGQEILQLQTRLRQSSESQDLSTARRTIRDLERRIEDYENQLAATNYNFPQANGNIDGNSELSIIRKDLSAARQKEIEFLKREAAHKDTVKGLKRQITDLERQAHEAEMSRLMGSPGTPSSQTNSARKAEVSELRHQLTAAHQATHDLKSQLRDSQRRGEKNAALVTELKSRLEELEEQKANYEQALDEAQRAADEAAAQHDRDVKKLKHRMERLERERRELLDEVHAVHQDTDHSDLSEHGRRELHGLLRQAQVDADSARREVQEHREALEELMAMETTLRRKLDRARSERAAYRASAEKLSRDVKALKATQRQQEEERAAKDKNKNSGALVPFDKDAGRGGGQDGGADTDAIIRGAEAAEQRHVKEIRGMTMQVEFLQARWEREARLRLDAAFAKKYLMLQLDVANACNKADLRVLHQIHRQLGIKAPVGPPLLPATKKDGPARLTLRTLAIAARFVARMRLGAQQWSRHEHTRQRLVACVEDMQRAERLKRVRGLAAAAEA